MRFKWDRFASHREMTRNARINWVIEWDERNVLQKLWEGDSFFDASYTRRSTPCSRYLWNESKGYLSMLTGQPFQRVTGGLHGVIDTYMVFPDRARTYLTRNSRTGWLNCQLPVEHLTFSFEKYSIGWLSLRRLSLMSDESWRYIPMLRQANILQPATVEAMRETKLKADYPLISKLLWDRSFIPELA